MKPYTLFPWSIKRIKGQAIAIYSGLRRIATIPHPDRVEQNDDNEANARLIAAAPELLAALERISIGSLTHFEMSRLARQAINQATAP